MRRGCTSVWRPKRALKWKVEPWPGVLSTQTWPSISSTSFLEMARPSPVPPYLRVVELSAWLNDWNNRSHCSAVIPMPLSRTQKCSSTCSPASAASSTPTTISPRSVNLAALLPRLTNTWPSRSESPTSAVGRSAEVANNSSRPLSSAFRPIMLAKFSSTSSSRNGACSMLILPASILEKSRISLMMPSRFSAERCTFSM